MQSNPLKESLICNEFIICLQRKISIGQNTWIYTRTSFCTLDSLVVSSLWLSTLMVLLRNRPPSSSDKVLKPWWNRPLVGDLSLWDRLNQLFYKEEIPDSVIGIHDVALSQGTKLFRRAKSIEIEKFGSKEFLAFARIKYDLAQNKKNNQNLEKYAQLLQVGMKTKKSFIALEQIEINHQGKKFNEFYEYVNSLLVKLSTPASFKVYLQPKFAEVYPTMSSEEGKTALCNYVRQLESLSEHELGLRLLAAFKAYKLSDYSILRKVSDMIKNLERQDLLDLKGLKVRIFAERSVFEDLAKIINIPEEERNTDTFSRILQYIALGEKHEASYPKFQELAHLLEVWNENYEAVQSIRGQYQSKRYKKVKTFLQTFPGIDLYDKYKSYFKEE
jgi:hypothetical protein